MRPYDAKNLDEVCTLRCDNKDVGDFWILTDGYQVSLRKQKMGEPPSEGICIPRAQFNRLIAWYMREQKPVKTKR